MIQKKLTVINCKGLHARACSALAALASTFEADISLDFNEQTADAKNILQLMMLAAAQDSKLSMSCSGDDEIAAATAIEKLFNDFFGEES